MNNQRPAGKKPWALLIVALVLGVGAAAWRLSRGTDPLDSSAQKAADRLNQAFEQEPVKPGTKLPDGAIDPGPGHRGAVGPQ